MKNLLLLLALATSFAAHAGTPPKTAHGHRFGLFGRFHAHQMKSGRTLYCRAR